MKYKYWFYGLLVFLISLVIDNRIIQYITGNRVSALNEIITQLTKYTNGFLTLFLIGLIIFVWKRKYLVRYVISFGIFGGIIWVIKYIIQRPRPFLDLDIISLIPVKAGYSFPSGHAGFAFFSLAFIWKLFPRFRWVWLVGVIIISLSRLYSGVHYLSDIIAGTMLGLFFGFYFFKQRFFKFKK